MWCCNRTVSKAPKQAFLCSWKIHGTSTSWRRANCTKEMLWTAFGKTQTQASGTRPRSVDRHDLVGRWRSHKNPRWARKNIGLVFPFGPRIMRWGDHYGLAKSTKLFLHKQQCKTSPQKWSKRRKLLAIKQQSQGLFRPHIQAQALQEELRKRWLQSEMDSNTDPLRLRTHTNITE